MGGTIWLEFLVLIWSDSRLRNRRIQWYQVFSSSRRFIAEHDKLSAVSANWPRRCRQVQIAEIHQAVDCHESPVMGCDEAGVLN